MYCNVLNTCDTPTRSRWYCELKFYGADSIKVFSTMRRRHGLAFQCIKVLKIDNTQTLNSRDYAGRTFLTDYNLPSFSANPLKLYSDANF